MKIYQKVWIVDHSKPRPDNKDEEYIMRGPVMVAKSEYDALCADNEWLREGLRGIARMDPKTEGDRMVLWANDTLSGRATDVPSTAETPVECLQMGDVIECACGKPIFLENSGNWDVARIRSLENFLRQNLPTLNPRYCRDFMDRAYAILGSKHDPVCKVCGTPMSEHPYLGLPCAGSQSNRGGKP